MLPLYRPKSRNARAGLGGIAWKPKIIRKPQRKLRIPPASIGTPPDRLPLAIHFAPMMISGGPASTVPMQRISGSQPESGLKVFSWIMAVLLGIGPVIL